MSCTMRCRFTIQPLFCDVKKIDFLISQIRFLLSEKYFLISQNNPDFYIKQKYFVISKNRICHITKSNL